MVIVLQRVNFASCTVNDKEVSQIKKGFLLLAGFSKEDNEASCEKLAKKIINLRIFSDENDKMNKNIISVNGSIMVISQFTLASDINSGNRPSFDSCMEPEKAQILFDYFVSILKNYNIDIKRGIFGEYMKIRLENDGPVTFVLKS